MEIFNSSASLCKEKLRENLALNLKTIMSRLLETGQNADVILISSDNQHLPAHMCILRARAPGFFNTYLAPVLNKIHDRQGQLQVSASVHDADFNTLRFFLKSVYTEDDCPSSINDSRAMEVNNFPGSSGERKGSCTGNNPDFKFPEQPSTDKGGTPNFGLSMSGASDQAVLNTRASNCLRSGESFTISSPDDADVAETSKDPQLDAIMNEVDRTIQKRAEVRRQAQLEKAEQHEIMQGYGTPRALSCKTDETLNGRPTKFVPHTAFGSRRSMTSFVELGHSFSSLNSPREELPETSSVFYAQSDVETGSTQGFDDNTGRVVLLGSESGPYPTLSRSLVYRTSQQQDHVVGIGRWDSFASSLAESTADNSMFSSAHTNETYGRPASLAFLSSSKHQPNQVVSSSMTLDSPMQHSYHGDTGILSERNVPCGRRNSDVFDLRHANSLQILPAGSDLVAGDMAENATAQNASERGKIFPLFIELDKTALKRSETVSRESVLQQATKESCGSNSDVRFSARRKRWSVISQDRLSIGSQENMNYLMEVSPFNIDTTESVETSLKRSRRDSASLSEDTANVFKFGNFEACSKLGYDLLGMLTEEMDADIAISVGNAAHLIRGHRGLLSCASEQMKTTIDHAFEGKVNFDQYREDTVRCILSIIYGGNLSLSPGINLREVVELSGTLGLSSVRSVVEYHLFTNAFHKFHRPCSSCAGNVKYLELLSKHGFDNLMTEALKWVTRYFIYLWPRKAFCLLPDDIQSLCYGSLIRSLNASRVIDVVIGCEQIRNHVARAKWSAPVLTMVSSLYDMSLEYASMNLVAIIASQRFLALGKGLDGDIGVIDDILSAAIHSITADTACKVHHRLDALTRVLAFGPSLGSLSERFHQLVKRLRDLSESHMLHHASQTVKCESWSTLSPDMQERILQGGIFVEFSEPTAAKPTLSSRNRTFKRSSSSGPVASHSSARTVKVSDSPRRSTSSTRSDKQLPLGSHRTMPSSNVESPALRRKNQLTTAAIDLKQLMPLSISEDMETSSPQDAVVAPSVSLSDVENQDSITNIADVAVSIVKEKHTLNNDNPIVNEGYAEAMVRSSASGASSLIEPTDDKPMPLSTKTELVVTESKEKELVQQPVAVPETKQRITKPTAEVKPIGKSGQDAGSINSRGKTIPSRVTASAAAALHRRLPVNSVGGVVQSGTSKKVAHSSVAKTSSSGVSASTSGPSKKCSSHGTPMQAHSADVPNSNLPVSTSNGSGTSGVSTTSGSLTFRVDSSTLTKRKAPELNS